MGLNDVPMKDLRMMRKDDILKLIALDRTTPKDETEPKTVNDSPPQVLDAASLLNQLMSLIKPILQDFSKQMSSELNELHDKFANLQSRVDPFITASHTEESPPDDEGEWEVQGKPKKSFSDVLRQSVKNAFQEEKIKCDVIISKLPESTDETTFVSELCSKLNLEAKPRNSHRLGKKERKKGDRPRLVKVSFPTAFDARTFTSGYDKFRREIRDDDVYGNLRIRPSRTKDEQAVFTKSSDIAHRLNTEAREKNLPESYSVRDNGSIWKYTKTSDGAWKRDRDWQPPSGNGQ